MDEYYKQIDIDEKQIKHIRTKTLILHARDDLVVTSQQLPINQLLENPNIILVQTKSGGHVCWYEGLNPIQRWYSKPVLQFFDALAKQDLP